MAFSTTIENELTLGNLKLFFGTYTNTSSSTGGDIVFPNTEEIFHVQLQPKGSAILANQPVVNETLPLLFSADATNERSSDANAVANVEVTIVTTADEVGTFFAIGQ
jgi:hypothetical protein